MASSPRKKRRRAQDEPAGKTVRAPDSGPASTRSPLREQVQAAYREAILDSAEAVFTRQGLHDVKMAAIAAEAGTSVGTIYNYFESKDDVFAALMSRGRERFFATLDAARAPDDPIDQLRALTTTAFQFVAEHGALFALHLRSGGDVAAELSGDAEAKQARERFMALVTSILADGVECGRLRDDVPVDTLAILLAGLLEGTATSATVEPESVDLTSLADTVVDFFLEGAARR